MTVQKFNFEVISKDGAPLSGHLFAETKNEAKQRLGEEGYAILSLQASSGIEKVNENILKFEFEATDTNGKNIRGEIEATDEYEAYKKLQIEYNFDAYYLANKKLSFEEKEKKKKEGIPLEIMEQYLEEEEILKNKEKEKKGKTEKNDQATVEELLAKKQSQMQAIKAEIETMIDEIQKLLKEYGDCVADEKRRSIESQLDKLARLRNSNSIEHLESVMKDLFKIILSDEIFITLQDQYVPEFDQKKEAFKDLALDLSNHFKKRIASLKLEMSLKKFEGLLKVAQNQKFDFIFEFLHIIFISFLSLLLGFFWFQVLKFLLGWESKRALFYLQSEFIWFCIFFSGMLYLLLFLRSFLQKKSIPIKKAALVYGIFTIITFILFVEFPVISFWTK